MNNYQTQIADAWEVLKNLPVNSELAQRVSSFFSELIDGGANRELIYRIAFGLTEQFADEMDSELYDLVRDYETTVSGRCAPSSIVKNPCDPDDQNELAEYVRSGKWTDDPSISPIN